MIQPEYFASQRIANKYVNQKGQTFKNWCRYYTSGSVIQLCRHDNFVRKMTQFPFRSLLTVTYFSIFSVFSVSQIASHVHRERIQFHIGTTKAQINLHIGLVRKANA